MISYADLQVHMRAPACTYKWEAAIYWWAMGHYASAMEAEHLSKQWHLLQFCMALHCSCTVPRVLCKTLALSLDTANAAANMHHVWLDELT